VTSRAASWLPGWAVLIALAVLAAALVTQARRSRLRAADPAPGTEAAGGLSPPDIGIPEITTSARDGQEAVTHER